ncbi:hypothetical protein ACQ1R0_03865 [Ornithobacterium rhinotracheale]|uniref:hypothetical protein n=1 Tax=Ornithobacterium rhinotracheale TaxID=28251 RepID=UPI0040361A45
MLRVIWIAEMLYNAYFSPDKEEKSFYQFKRELVANKARNERKRRLKKYNYGFN